MDFNFEFRIQELFWIWTRSEQKQAEQPLKLKQCHAPLITHSFFFFFNVTTLIFGPILYVYFSCEVNCAKIFRSDLLCLAKKEIFSIAYCYVLLDNFNEYICWLALGALGGYNSYGSQSWSKQPEQLGQLWQQRELCSADLVNGNGQRLHGPGSGSCHRICSSNHSAFTSLEAFANGNYVILLLI